jgi:hypothetical protein
LLTSGEESALSRRLIRTATVAVTAGLALLVLGSPAWAHTEIEIDNPQGGATGVTMTVNAEAESDSAGIASVQMALPAGIAPAQVSLTSGPAGWTLTQGADGFTVAGAALPVHKDAKFVVKLAQLPPAGGVLVFKTLVTYSNGKVDRWIEEPTPSNPNPPDPAPTVSVRPGAAVATSAPPSTAPAASPTTGPATPTSATAQPAASGGNGLVWLVVTGVLVLAALAGTLFALRRRRAGS